MKKFRAGVIGLGSRGTWWVTDMLTQFKNIDIKGLCDIYQDRIDLCKNKLEEGYGISPTVLTDNYIELINNSEIDIILIFSSWNNHFNAAIEAMKCKKPVATEVGGAYSIEQCRELVKVQQQTETPFMLLENCCYGKYELMVLNMVQKGLLGEIVHCDGGYLHDLRDEISRGNENRHYRFNEYVNRNCENYPTHEIGPISKILGINNGNRFVSLVSMSSKSRGLHQYIQENDDLKKKYSNVKFNQGDVCNTIIRCADGETVAITLDTTLPRYYSRNFTVRGTKGMYEENTHSVFLDSKNRENEFDWKENFNNEVEYYKDWAHPIWKEYEKVGVKEQGHGGMDYLVMDAFLNALENNLPMPIDVYDAVSWMCITALSEKSIAQDSQPVVFPDFTDGAWYYKKKEPDWKYKLFNR